MDTLFKFLDGLWNLKWIKGHRTKTAQTFLMLCTVVLGYQGAAIDPQLIGAGIDLPDVPSKVLLLLAPFAGYFANKVKQFATEHV